MFPLARQLSPLGLTTKVASPAAVWQLYDQFTQDYSAANLVGSVAEPVYNIRSYTGTPTMYTTGGRLAVPLAASTSIFRYENTVNLGANIPMIFDVTFAGNKRLYLGYTSSVAPTGFLGVWFNTSSPSALAYWTGATLHTMCTVAIGQAMQVAVARMPISRYIESTYGEGTTAYGSYPYVFIKHPINFPTWRLVGAFPLGLGSSAITPVSAWPSVMSDNRAGEHYVDNIRVPSAPIEIVPLVSDAFESQNYVTDGYGLSRYQYGGGGLTWNVAAGAFRYSSSFGSYFGYSFYGNTAGESIATIDAGTGNVFLNGNIGGGTSDGSLIGLIARYTDANNFLYFTYSQAGNLSLKKRVAGVETTLATGSGVYVAGRLLWLRVHDNAIYAGYNTNTIVNGIALDPALTGTKVGVYAYKSQMGIDNFYCLPTGSEGQWSVLDTLV